MGLLSWLFGKKDKKAAPAGPAAAAPAAAQRTCPECARALLPSTPQCPFCKPQRFVAEPVDGTVAVDSGQQQGVVSMAGVATALQLARLNGAKGFLHIYEGPNKGLSVLLGPRTLTMGRGADSMLALNDPGTSTKHAEIRPSGKTWAIVDVGAKNGVFVNDSKVKEKMLVNGDIILCGTSRMYVGVMG